MKSKLFVLILLLGAFFRLYGVNWDQGQHLHPDERFLTMVTDSIKWPQTFEEYLNSKTSTLNPHNNNYGFFVYGLFPITLVKFTAENLDMTGYGNLTPLGREMSAFFDIGTMVLVYLTLKLGIKGLKNEKMRDIIPYMGMFFYAVSVLPIQLSHFYATDTFLVFFITLTFYLSILWLDKKKKSYLFPILIGISFGLSLASKISGGIFGIIPEIIILYICFEETNKNKKKKMMAFLSKALIYNVIFLFFAYLSLRLGSPYTFETSNFFDLSLNAKVVDNWKQLKSFDDPNGYFPPGIQWIKTTPFLFPLKNMLFYGLGIPLGILSILAIMYYLACILYFVSKRKFDIFLNSKFLILNSSLLWILLLFFYQGGQFIKTLRYFYPFYPFLAIILGYFLYDSYIHLKEHHSLSFSKFKIGLYILVFILLLYPTSFMSIYSRLHSRVAASEWIFNNVPTGIFKSDEHWDDGLPMSLGSFIHENYTGVEFPLYGIDNQEKWQEMAQKLTKVDYIFLTSNRLYGSIMTVPEKYPITPLYYQKLFDGSLGFEKVAEFTSRPNIPLPFIKICITPPFSYYGAIAQKSQECNEPGISFVDDYADETFTVYDHPKVIIFKKVRSVDYLNLLLGS